MSKDELAKIIVAYGDARATGNALLSQWAGEKVVESLAEVFKPQPSKPTLEDLQ